MCVALQRWFNHWLQAGFGIIRFFFKLAYVTDFCYFFLSSAWAGQIPLLWSLNILGWKCKAGKLVPAFYFSFSCFIGHPKRWRERSTQNTHFPTSQNPCCTNTIKIRHQEMALKPVCCKHAQFQQTVNRFPLCSRFCLSPTGCIVLLQQAWIWACGLPRFGDGQSWSGVTCSQTRQGKENSVPAAHKRGNQFKAPKNVFLQCVDLLSDVNCNKIHLDSSES